MAATVPLGLPIRARAGDSWLFDLLYAPYPQSDGWTPAVHVRGPDALTWDAAWAVVNGDGWRITIPAASTKDLPTGTYKVAAVLTGSGITAGQVVTVEVVDCVLQSNLATAVAGDETVWEETAIAALKSAILELTTGRVKFYMIGTRQVTYHDLPELTATLGRMEARLARKRNPAGLGQSVKTRFKEASA